MPELLSAAALAAHLGVSPQTVNRLRRAGRIPFVALGRGLTRYDLAGVVAALEVPAQPVPPPSLAIQLMRDAGFDFRGEIERRRRELTGPRAARRNTTSPTAPTAARPERVGHEKIAARG